MAVCAVATVAEAPSPSSNTVTTLTPVGVSASSTKKASARLTPTTRTAVELRAQTSFSQQKAARIFTPVAEAGAHAYGAPLQLPARPPAPIRPPDLAPPLLPTEAPTVASGTVASSSSPTAIARCLLLPTVSKVEFLTSLYSAACETGTRRSSQQGSPSAVEKFAGFATEERHPLQRSVAKSNSICAEQKTAQTTPVRLAHLKPELASPPCLHLHDSHVVTAADKHTSSVPTTTHLLALASQQESVKHKAKMVQSAMLLGGSSRVTERPVAILPSGEQLSVALSKQSPQVGASSSAFVDHVFACERDWEGKTETTDTFFPKLSPAVLTSSERAEVLTNGIERTTTIATSMKELKADILLHSSSVAFPQRPALLEGASKIEQPHHYLSQTNRHVHTTTRTRNQSDSLRCMDETRASDSPVTKGRVEPPEANLNCPEWEECEGSESRTMRNQQQPQTGNAAGTSQPVAYPLHCVLPCIGASHRRRACSARRPEVKLRSVSTLTAKQPPFSAPMEGHATSYGIKELDSFVERTPSLRSEEEGEHTGRGSCESKSCGTQFQKKHLSHLCQRSEALRGARYDPSSIDRETFRPERGSYQIADSQQRRFEVSANRYNDDKMEGQLATSCAGGLSDERKARTSTSFITGGVSDFLSSEARGSQKPADISPTSVQSSPQAHAVIAGQDDVRGTSDGNLLDSESSSRTPGKFKKDRFPDTQRLEELRERDGRAETYDNVGVQITCNAVFGQGRNEDSPPLMCVGISSVLKHSREGRCLTEHMHVRQGADCGTTNNRFFFGEFNCGDGERGCDKTTAEDEFKQEDADGEVQPRSSEPCRGPHAVDHNKRGKNTEITGADAFSVDFCQRTNCVESEGRQARIPAVVESLFSTQCDRMFAGKHCCREGSRCGPSLACKGAAIEQAAGGDLFAVKERLEALSLDVREDKLAIMAPERHLGTLRQGALDAQRMATAGGRTAAERLAATSYTVGGGTEVFAAQEHAYTDTLLSQKEQDSQNDRAGRVVPEFAGDNEHADQGYFDAQMNEEAAAGFIEGLCERGAHLSNSKKCVGKGDTEESSEIKERRTKPCYAGGIDLDIFSSQIALCLPTSSERDISLSDVYSNTQLEIVPYCRRKSRQPVHLPQPRLSISDHLSDSQRDATLSSKVRFEGLPPSRRATITADVADPISQRLPSKNMCRCISWTSRLSPVIRRQLSTHAVLTPTIKVAESQRSMLCCSSSDSCMEGFFVQKMSTKKTSARGDVSQLANYSTRPVCAACESRVAPVRGSCTGNAPQTEPRGEARREGCGLRDDVVRALLRVSETVYAGPQPEAAKICPSAKTTPQNGSALRADICAHSVSDDTSRISRGCMFSVATASRPHHGCPGVPPTFPCGTPRQLPRGSAAGCMRAAAAVRRSIYANDRSGEWETKLKISDDSPSRWAHDGTLEVVKSRLTGSVHKGGWRVDGEWRFSSNDAATEVGEDENAELCKNLCETHDSNSLTQAFQEASRFIDSVDEASVSRLPVTAECMRSDCVGERDLAGTALPSSTPRDFPKARILSHPPDLRSMLASQPMTGGHDAAAQVKPEVSMHTHCHLLTSRQARVSAPFKPPATSVPGRAGVSFRRLPCRIPSTHVTAKVSQESVETTVASYRLPRRNTSYLLSPPVSRLSERNANSVASSVEPDDHAKAAGDQRRQDLTLLLQVAGVSPGDVLEVRFPFPVVAAEDRQTSDAVNADGKAYSKLDANANEPVSPTAHAATTQAPLQQVNEGSTHGRFCDELINVVAVSSRLTGSHKEEVCVAEKSNEAPSDGEQHFSGDSLGKKKARACEQGSWVQAEVVLPETREIEEKSCRRIMQLTYKSLPGLSTKVVFLGFHRILCLSSSRTLDDNQRRQRKIRRVVGETTNWHLQDLPPFGDVWLMSTLHGKILEFRKPVAILAELNITPLCGAFSAADIFGICHVNKIEGTQQIPAVEHALLKEFTKLPLVTKWLQELVQRQRGSYYITRDDIRRFASGFQLHDC